MGHVSISPRTKHPQQASRILTHIMKSIGWIVIVLGTTACAATLDSQSGGDHLRSQAVELQLDKDHHDSVSASAGDHTDWKKIQIPMDASYMVHMFWDSPYSEITLHVMDQAGRLKFRLQKTRGQDQNRWRGLRLREGMHYLKIRAHKMGSVYTLKIAPDDGE